MPRDIIIANGTVIHATNQEKADVAIAGKKIVAVGKGLAKHSPGATIIDASEKYVVPGGVDVHVHLELPFCGTVSADNWDCGTRAAARGGVTTVIDFAIPYGNESLEDAYHNWKAKAQKSCIDYCFHLAITNWDRHGPEMAKMVGRGCPTFKEFMIYASEGWQSDDRAIFNALEQCKRLGGMLLVHAESARVLDELIARHHTPELMQRHGARLHAMTRPNYIEAEAIQRCVQWAEATGGRLYIVHMSTAEGADTIKAAQARGVDVYAETCVQYLTLDDSVFAKEDGHLFACCPQVKKKRDQQRLWQGLRDGEVCVVSTDTCTFTRAQKDRWEGDWTKIPMGLPGLETLLPLMWTHGTKEGGLSLSQIVEKCCTNPARIMGLYPRKGVLQKGSDADVVILDPRKKFTVDPTTMAGGADWSPYLGWRLWGWAETTFCRGKKIVEDYQFTGENGWGQWLPREKAGSLPRVATARKVARSRKERGPAGRR